MNETDALINVRSTHRAGPGIVFWGEIKNSEKYIWENYEAGTQSGNDKISFKAIFIAVEMSESLQTK